MISIWVQYDNGKVYDVWFWNESKTCEGLKGCKDEEE